MTGLPWPDILREHGFRVTCGRLPVLEAIQVLEHPTIEDLHRVCREGELALTTIYRGIDALEAAGLVWAVHVPGKGRVYHLRSCDPHAHLVCRRCGRISDVTFPPDVRVGQLAAISVQFVIDQVDVTGVGVCSICSAAKCDHSPESEPVSTISTSLALTQAPL